MATAAVGVVQVPVTRPAQPDIAPTALASPLIWAPPLRVTVPLLPMSPSQVTPSVVQLLAAYAPSRESQLSELPPLNETLVPPRAGKLNAPGPAVSIP